MTNTTVEYKRIENGRKLVNLRADVDSLISHLKTKKKELIDLSTQMGLDEDFTADDVAKLTEIQDHIVSESSKL